MGPAHEQDLEELAGELRALLLVEAPWSDEDDLSERIRALVDREAGLLRPELRAELVRRVTERSFGLGPLEPLLADPGVDEVMVNGTRPVWVDRARRLH